MQRGRPEGEAVSPSRLELLGAATPKRPDKDSPASTEDQVAERILAAEGRRRRAHHPRRGTCLLKGCGQVFRPQQPRARYCSEACQAEARRWRRWKARRRYRLSLAN